MNPKKTIMPIKVECYEGYRGAETPRVIWFKSRKIEIKQVLDRWLDPNHRYFKLLDDDGDVYIIRHDMNTWAWELTFYQEAPNRENT